MVTSGEVYDSELAEPVRIPPGVRAVETHISVLYFVDDLVYKTKKPLDFGFAEFSSRAARYDACRHEVDLNRRLSPDVYLGVREVVVGSGAPEPAVAMRALPAEQALACLVGRDDPSLRSVLRELARTLAAFHATCEVHSEANSPGSYRHVWDRWHRECAQLPADGGVMSASDIAEITRLGTAFLSGRQRLFDERLAAGLIRDGHGDLQAADIFVLDDGPRIIDCLEFDSALRIVDVLSDVAFLAMDLERLGHPAQAAEFLADYAEFSAETHPSALLDFFIAYRALIRAKVGSIRLAQGESEKAPEVRTLVDLCLSHLRRATIRLVVVGGLPGSGKSTVAEKIARHLGATYLSSDDIRDEMRARPPHPVPEGWRSGAYAPAAIREVYAELIRRAEVALSRGCSAVVDASWSQTEHRGAIRSLGRTGHATLSELCCEVDDVIAATRLERRHDSNSDADEGVRRQMKAAFAIWPEATRIDNNGTSDAAVTRALRAIG